MRKVATIVRASCAIAWLFAIASSAVAAVGQTSAKIDERPKIDARTLGGKPAPLTNVRDYRLIFQQCHDASNQPRLAIRSMSVNGEALLLTVDPTTLATSLDPQSNWTCADTDDTAQKDTRFMRAIQTPSRLAINAAASRPAYLRDAGVIHGVGEGSFITGDLCPSSKPLDRGFLEMLEKTGPRTPVSLSISGLWLTHHRADFQWLRDQARSGALDITWVNHSYHHPYFPGRPLATNFLLAPGFDIQAEILDTERLLIANGGTPSVFFRFPGLISDATLMDAVRRDHLVSLGADGWLVFAPPLRPGAILLVHPNGNEPGGLGLFSKLMDKGTLPRPFRPINEAP